jgi:hypothetical protein
VRGTGLSVAFPFGCVCVQNGFGSGSCRGS